jgi:hypothetical protein
MMQPKAITVALSTRRNDIVAAAVIAPSYR